MSALPDSVLGAALRLVDAGWMPDRAIRYGIRRLCRQRLIEEAARHDPAAFVERMRASEVAPVPDMANRQHYEVPPEFFALALGKRRKYSCCYWPHGCPSLDAAEELALSETCARARLGDGQDILELGCGWGSLTLWMAECYPAARITAVSNSAPQRAYIEGELRRRGLSNARVITADMNHFDAPARYDRVVSVEMFEHMRNWQELLRRVASWLHPDGRLFVHIFCHRRFLYEYETAGEHNWMGRYFFTGGIMPSADIFTWFRDHFELEEEWRWDGTHYQKTAEAWLRNLDARARAALPILERTYGKGQGRKWLQRWRVFFMACAELWGYAGGSEWLVGHYRLARR